ncbi:nucleotidyltransferase family protein [Sinomonas sp. ASV322]|uniref:nucleotidyltransferase family protein n=1 Tax=Sinomonas sp. ASV322 TaxID=3041920 RepID=UPI0027DB70F5|nr:nucleotidyltransferase family protein [Sinomonas sp. ASV322]MDQ4500723.1 nucleotidyltransferase family protein [Sinomonas sp. ASV322]
MRAELSAPVAGILLAAGAGRRFGGPKALASSPETGSWLQRGVELLTAAGCAPVVVVLGASADEALALLPDDPRVVPIVAEGWAEGVGASLRAALELLAGRHRTIVAALVTLVDLPRLDGEALARVAGGAVGPSSLRRAIYGNTPGHPVLIGREHWGPLGAILAGDVGAGPYLRAHAAEPVDCTGLGGDEDIDRQSGSDG